MDLKKGIMFLAITVLLCTNSGIILAEDNTTVIQEGAPSESVDQKIVADTSSDSGAQWLWGEVVSVDLQNNTVKVKYLDYETDTEKEMDLVVDEKTVYENIKSLEELKALNTASIDYILGPDGKVIIRNISVEKPEASPVAQEGASEVSRGSPVTEGQVKTDEQPKAEQAAAPAQEALKQ